MSAQYVFRLRAVRDDYEIAFAALSHMVDNWHCQEINDAIPFALSRVRTAQGNLETAHFLRLTAEFESILRDHLRTNHAAVKFPARKADWKVDWFLSRVCQRESLVLPTELRRRLDEIRDYRNSLAHGGAMEDQIALDSALRAYNSFVNRLPEPFG